MRQAVGKRINGNAETSTPSGDDGMLLSDFTPSRKPKSYLAKIKASAAGTFKMIVRGRNVDDGDWGRLHNETGYLAGGATFTGPDTWYIPLEWLGTMERVHFQAEVLTGTPTVTVEVAEVYEDGD